MLGQSGNFDIAGTAAISSAISGGFGFTKTGAGLLTLSGAVNNGGTITNAGTGTTGNLVTTANTVPAAALYISGAIGNNVTGIVQNSATSDLLLGGNNSAYTGGITVQSGTLLLNNTANALGANTNVVTLGNSSANATIQYGGRLGNVTGGNQTFANPIHVNGTGVNVLSATDYGVTFSGPITLGGGGTNLTLASLNSGGSGITISGGVTGTGNIIVSDDFANAGGIVSFTTTQVNNVGTITFNNASVNGGTVGTGTGTNTITGGVGSNVTGITNAGTNPLTISTGALNLNSAGTTLTNSGALFTVSSAITGSAGLTFTSPNNSAFTLSGASNYTGATSLNSGTLTLTGSLTSTTFNLGGGVFNYSSTATTPTQTFTTTNLTGFATVNNTVAADTLALGSIVRTTPGVVSFGNTTGKITTTSTGDGSGILGPWATIGTGTSLNYAVPSTTAISAYSGGTALPLTGGSATANYTLGNAGQTLTAAVTGNTLQVLNTDVTAITLANGGNNLTLNGILNSGGTAGGLTISGTGKLIAGSTGEIDLTNNAEGMTISSVIADPTSGKTSVVFNSIGGGGLTLGTNNTYTGNTYINGTVATGSNAAFGVGGTIFLGATGSATTSQINDSGGATLTIANPMSVQAGGSRSITSNSGGGAVTLNGAITLNNGATFSFGPNTTSNYTITGGVTGTGNLDLSYSNSRSGNTTVSGGAVNMVGVLLNDGNSETGADIVSANIGSNVTSVTQGSTQASFILSGTNSFQAAAVNAGILDYQNVASKPAAAVTTVAAAGSLVLGVGTAPANFTSANVDSLFAGTLANVTINSASGVGIDTTAGNFTYNTAQNSGRVFIKTGANTLTLGASDTFGGLSIISGVTAGTLDIGATTLTLNGSTSNTFSGIIAGSGGTLARAGTGTETLSGANTYSGGTTVSVGTLIAAASSTPTTGTVTSGPLGTGAITLAGGRLSSDGGANRMLANAVSVTGTAGEFTTGGKDFFLNGAVTGTGTFTVGNSFVSTTAASVDFGDNLNGFTGTVNYIGNATDNIIFNSVLNTAAKFSLSGLTANQQIYLNAAGNNTIGELSGTGGKISAFTPATTLLINQSTSTTYAGALTQGSAALSVTKANAGTLALTFANLYTGATTVTGGVLSTGATGLLANGGTASSIGKSAVAAGNLVLDGGTLQYANTGAAESTNRLFTIGSTTAGATGTLDASGANPISFTGTGAVAYGTSGQARTLGLTGTNTGANTLSPVIGDNGAAAVAVTKGGTGRGPWRARTATAAARRSTPGR